MLPLFIPAMFLVIFLEWRHDKAHGHQHFKFESSVMNICCGLIERVMDLYVFIGLFLWFEYLQSHVGFLTISPTNPFAWIALIFLVDFLIYWFHRGGHTINLLWGAHVTHHQCEEFNFTVAFRNSIFPHIFRGIILSVVAIIGFGGEMIIIALTINGIWQFAIHTTKVDKMGILEGIIATPSSHRVHHACNDLYLDRNFGGMLMIWDKIFGTYQAEIEAPVYGLKNPIQTNNPLHAYTHVWQDMIRASWHVKRVKDLLKIWFGTPAGFYSRYKIEQPQAPAVTPRLSNQLLHYIIGQIVMLTTLLLLTLMFEEFISPIFRMQNTVLLVVSSISVCLLMSPSKWTFRFELLRLVCITGVALHCHALVGMWLVVLLPVSLIWFLWVWGKFNENENENKNLSKNQ